MGKLIWKGFNKQGEKISFQSFAITGANLRRNSEMNSTEPKDPASGVADEDQPANSLLRPPVPAK